MSSFVFQTFEATTEDSFSIRQTSMMKTWRMLEYHGDCAFIINTHLLTKGILSSPISDSIKELATDKNFFRGVRRGVPWEFFWNDEIFNQPGGFTLRVKEIVDIRHNLKRGLHMTHSLDVMLKKGSGDGITHIRTRVLPIESAKLETGTAFSNRWLNPI